MEELLIKYSFGECSPEELSQFKQLLTTHPYLKEEFDNIARIDEVLGQKLSKKIGLNQNYESHLTKLLSNEMAAKAKPQLVADIYTPINIDALEKKSILQDYLGPILFAIGSFICILVYGIQYNAIQTGTTSIFSDHSSTLLLGSLCLLGLFFLDQLLSKKQATKQFLFSV